MQLPRQAIYYCYYPFSYWPKWTEDTALDEDLCCSCAVSLLKCIDKTSLHPTEPGAHAVFPSGEKNAGDITELYDDAVMLSSLSVWYPSEPFLHCHKPECRSSAPPLSQ